MQDLPRVLEQLVTGSKGRMTLAEGSNINNTTLDMRRISTAGPPPREQGTRARATRCDALIALLSSLCVGVCR